MTTPEAPEAPPSRVRHGVQQTLVWFGLAVEPGEEPEKRQPRSRLAEAAPAVLVAVMLTSLVWDDRGSTAGGIVLGAFAVVFVATLLKSVVEDFLALAVILSAGLLILVPDRTEAWIPVAVGLALAVLISMLSRRSRRDAEAGRST